MDNVFSEIKGSLPMPEVARFYGLEMNRAGMACCPFHDDKNPSLKVYDDHFYCFGCGVSGDQTGFVAKLFELRQIDAAIGTDFLAASLTSLWTKPRQMISRNNTKA